MTTFLFHVVRCWVNVQKVLKTGNFTPKLIGKPKIKLADR